MHVRKRAKSWSVEIKKNDNRIYKGGFRTKREALEFGAKKEK